MVSWECPSKPRESSGLDPEAVHTLVLDYAWGGLGAAIGPTLIATLWWKRFTAKGSVASMIVGTVTMIIWPQWGTILEALGTGIPSAEASPFLNGLLTVYGLFPAFVLSVVALIVVSLLTTPPNQEDIDDHFDVFQKPLSAVMSEDRGTTGTPDFLTDGGTPQTKAITEMDSVRAHVEDADYWEDHDQDDRTSK
jgi:sodium/proline symporter